MCPVRSVTYVSGRSLSNKHAAPTKVGAVRFLSVQNLLLYPCFTSPLKVSRLLKVVFDSKKKCFMLANPASRARFTRKRSFFLDLLFSRVCLLWL